MAKQMSQASLDAQETQLDSTASKSAIDRQHRFPSLLLMHILSRPAWWQRVTGPAHHLWT
jgi:hypothetical protein